MMYRQGNSGSEKLTNFPQLLERETRLEPPIFATQVGEGKRYNPYDKLKLGYVR